MAGFNGNISFNDQYPSDIFFRTTQMGLNVLDKCRKWDVKKVVSALTSCAYSPSDEPLKEEDFLVGIPHKSVEAHGLAKRNIFTYGKLLNHQYKRNICCSGLFNTAYGPFDNFNPDKTKVVGSFITKFLEAIEEKKDTINFIGSGDTRREFIYCTDAADGLVQILEKYDDYTLPLNIGFGTDLLIKDLAAKIAKLVGFVGEIKWGENKEMIGQPRKILNCERMKKFNININKTSLDNGLIKTIAWYKNIYGK